MITNIQEVIRALLTTLSSLIAHHTSNDSDSYQMSDGPLLLCVGVHQPIVPHLTLSDEEWEDLCRDCGGWEWIDGEIEGEAKNAYGG